MVLHVGATRASGLGCSGSRLARAGSLRIPPFSPDPGCAGRDQVGRAPFASGGPILAQMTLPQPFLVTVVWDTLATSPETGPVVSGQGNSVASEAAPPQSHPALWRARIWMWYWQFWQSRLSNCWLTTPRHWWGSLGLPPALAAYVERTRSVRTTYQLFVCYGERVLGAWLSNRGSLTGSWKRLRQHTAWLAGQCWDLWWHIQHLVWLRLGLY